MFLADVASALRERVLQRVNTPVLGDLVEDFQVILWHILTPNFLITSRSYLDAANFWIQNAQREPNATFERFPPEGYWRQRTKRTLRSLFFANRDQLIWDWQDYFVSCEFDGRKCDLDAVALLMPTAIMPTSSEQALPEKSEWNYPGLIKEVAAHIGPKLPSAWPDDEPDLRKMNYEPPEWPRGKVVIIDHPSKYFCFQTWDDRLFLTEPSSSAAVRDAKRAIAMDGFHVIIHGDSKNTTAGSFPVDDINKAGSSRSAYSFGIRFGQQASISLGQFVHQRVSTVYRPCGKRIASHNFLELSSFVSSGGFARRYYQLAYDRKNCVVFYRQLVMFHRCRCFSEDYGIPLAFASSLLQLGVAAMTGDEVIDANIPKKWWFPVLIKLNQDIQRRWLCATYCQEVISHAETIQRKPIPTDLPASITDLSHTVNKSDLIAISVHANSARVRIISEGEQMNIFNLIASIGGTFGLYVGLSGVTLFEIIEALGLVLWATPAMCRIYGRRLGAKWHNRHTKDITSQ
ncbi:hypothetical protein AHF37_05353 [Paragonimus kellicotti]|nr:hypothetical protein AHF37_05353 [Paragonimus kellicotti]